MFLTSQVRGRKMSAALKGFTLAVDKGDGEAKVGPALG